MLVNSLKRTHTSRILSLLGAQLSFQYLKVRLADLLANGSQLVRGADQVEGAGLADSTEKFSLFLGRTLADSTS